MPGRVRTYSRLRQQQQQPQQQQADRQPLQRLDRQPLLAPAPPPATPRSARSSPRPPPPRSRVSPQGRGRCSQERRKVPSERVRDRRPSALTEALTLLVAREMEGSRGRRSLCGRCGGSATQHDISWPAPPGPGNTNAKRINVSRLPQNFLGKYYNFVAFYIGREYRSFGLGWAARDLVRPPLDASLYL